MAGQQFWFRQVTREQVRPCIPLAVLSQEVCTATPTGKGHKGIEKMNGLSISLETGVDLPISLDSSVLLPLS